MLNVLREVFGSPFFWWFWGIFLLGAALGAPLGQNLRRRARLRRVRVRSAKALVARASADKLSAAAAGGPRKKASSGRGAADNRRIKASKFPASPAVWVLLNLIGVVLFFGLGALCVAGQAADPAVLAWKAGQQDYPLGAQSLTMAYGEQFLSRLPALAGFLGGGLLWSLFGPRLRISVGAPVLVFLVIALSSYSRNGGAQLQVDRVPLTGSEDIVVLRPFLPPPPETQAEAGYYRFLVSGWNLVPESAAFAWPRTLLSSWSIEYGSVVPVAPDRGSSLPQYRVERDVQRLPAQGQEGSELALTALAELEGLGVSSAFSYRSGFLYGNLDSRTAIVFWGGDFSFLRLPDGRY